MNPNSTNNRIIVADDEPHIRRLLSYNIQQMGYRSLEAADGAECIRLLDTEKVTALLLDINMPQKNGFEILEYVDKTCPNLPVIMITAANSIESAVKAIKMGAFDYLTKPIDLERLETTLKNGLSMRQLKNEVDQLQIQLRQSDLFADIIGASDTLNEVFELADRVLETDATVLIVGESGTGKELLARAIHQGSKRRNGPFVPVNCAAIPEQLADSLFLGHKKGAFTGASENQSGYFEQADQGTIFLDEIGDMDIDLQAKVLRILEEKAVRPLGEKKEKKLSFRIICATNRDLSEAIYEQTFRKDLLYRLEEYPIYLPSLRERATDIPLLAQHFLQEFCRENDMPEKAFTPDAAKQLISHKWPGNIRELKNVVRRGALRTAGTLIEEFSFFNLEEEQDSSNRSSPERGHKQLSTPGETALNLDTIEMETIKRAYISADRNALEAAKVLGISRATMYRKLKKLKIQD